MSNPRPDLSVAVEDAAKVVKFLGSINFVNKIYVNGSRSPKSRRKPRDTSDWDFICITDKAKVFLKPIRESHKLHGDVIFVKEIQLEHYPNAVEIWPTDKYKVLSYE